MSATATDTPVASGGTVVIVTDTPLPALSVTRAAPGSPSAGRGQMWVPAALLLVMAVLMLRRRRE
jgi:MYXO-CTERM domain-containing protein